MTMRSYRERAIIALWILCVVWCSGCAIIVSYLAFFSTEADRGMAAVVATIAAIAAPLAMLLRQYVVLGYASPLQLFKHPGRTAGNQNGSRAGF